MTSDKNTLDNELFYEHLDWVEYSEEAKLKRKTEKVFETIPSVVTTIIDIGCGDWAITKSIGWRI